MTMTRFKTLFPEVADSETRTITFDHDGFVPRGKYILEEFYCARPGCDCRGVMIGVIDARSGRQHATIGYGFEPPESPLADEDEDESEPFLIPLSPQSRLSSIFLHVFERLIADDGTYREDLERHYAMWKRAIDHFLPLARDLVQAMQEHEPWLAQEPIRRAAAKIGRNQPCPCGSGRKYKNCCRDR